VEPTDNSLSSNDEILTIQEAALLLKIGKRTVAKLAIAKKIPAKKLGAQWRFSRRALLFFIEGNLGPPAKSKEKTR
jgi:excisionase family DNA binding protein